MTYGELFKEFTDTVPVEVSDYRPFRGKETIVVWTNDGKSIVAKRIGKNKFEITENKTENRIYETIYQIGKNGEKIVFNHNREKLSESECIWKIKADSISFSHDGGITWIEV